MPTDTEEMKWSQFGVVTLRSERLEMRMKKQFSHIIQCLRKIEKIGTAKQVIVGFDGFVDEITKVIKHRMQDGRCSFFQTISEFSEHIGNAAGKSADIELITTNVKLGGNAPIMANALAALGIETTCIGAMGAPKEYDVFRKMNEKCRRISICNPGYTHAFEFQDGKLMFANLTSLEELTWTDLKKKIKIRELAEMFRISDLIALVNWSATCNTQTIWEGIFQEVLSQLDSHSLVGKRFFFDLADPYKRSREDIQAVMGLINQYAGFGRVILGLNENEACRLYDALPFKESKEGLSLEEKGEHIFAYTNIELLLIHLTDRCIAVNRDGVFQELGRVVCSPRISTGGGDNFNAGYCFGAILGLNTKDSIILGMAVSGSYIKNGRSPSIPDLVEYLSEWEDDN